MVSWDNAIGRFIPSALPGVRYFGWKGTSRCVDFLVFSFTLHALYMIVDDLNVLSVGAVTYRMEYKF